MGRPLVSNSLRDDPPRVVMFKKVLIANRGAIATRIIRTLQKLNITAVAVYAEADADSLHVSGADEAYSLGEGTVAQTYLNQDKLFEILAKSGAEAVHPGYGFLSENPQFARRCEQNNVVFLGPTAEQMELFGLKHSARTAAEQSNVPLLPGSGLLDNLDEALQTAEQIAYPVMLKSTAGGGGIGMQLCFSARELSESYDSVKRLGENNFSNAGVFLEKFVEHARHIEVQVFGDGKGNAIALCERDCSAQRRNQKVVEETPAPHLSEAVRQELQDVAKRLVCAVNYRSAGTVEFVYDQQDEKFYFLEVNTRLQVEHGVTEKIYDIDLVEWMVRLGCQSLQPLETLEQGLSPQGHAIQVRIYAEDANKNFQPSTGLLSEVVFPETGQSLRIDHWIEAGVEVSPFYDPMLAKVIVHAADRQQALQQLSTALQHSSLYGVETNREYLLAVLAADVMRAGTMTTRYLNDFCYQPTTIDVLQAGTLTTIQDYPGRTGFWDIGVPPSGPFDERSFRLGNRLLGNAPDAAGLEITLNGPTLKFNSPTSIVLAGALMDVSLDGESIEFWQVVQVSHGSVLKINKPQQAGARAYLLVRGGIQCPDYLNSKSTFTLGNFGGHAGRALRNGDVVHIHDQSKLQNIGAKKLDEGLLPLIDHSWQLRVIYGPHGAPDFFTDDDIETFFASEWEVHYNSSRTGVRLIGPKPKWARSDGGEAGMHPSNIHDNAYAIGTIDFTGDMPVILGPDGPSLGGFVCPATVIKADLWKIGQLKAGDKIRFLPVSIDDAVALERAAEQELESLSGQSLKWSPKPVIKGSDSPVLLRMQGDVDVVYRPSGDKYLLVEYGELELDIALRFRVHALMLHLQKLALPGVLELTPGIRSLQIHYDSLQLSLSALLEKLQQAEAALENVADLEVPARIVHLPLSWNDDACQQAIQKYMQSVRKEAPWCPSNIEFIRRINGLESVAAVKDIVFSANYVVMGLGDVYLGAPVATPLNPCHRLVTTKYNPARTWTAENSVGIGGSYLCVYGMEGPGGYQFVGRTLQMWNRYRQSKEFSQPWLLRFFDQIKFYEVDDKELLRIRREFPKGNYPLSIEQTSFRLAEYQAMLNDNQEQIAAFTAKREAAFNEELQRWIESGQMNFESEQHTIDVNAEETELADGCEALESSVAGNIWQVLVAPGDDVEEGQVVLVIESMKMEIEVHAHTAGKVETLLVKEGSQVGNGQRLLIIKEQ